MELHLCPEGKKQTSPTVVAVWREALSIFSAEKSHQSGSTYTQLLTNVKCKQQTSLRCLTSWEAEICSFEIKIAEDSWTVFWFFYYVEKLFVLPYWENKSCGYIFFRMKKKSPRNHCCYKQKVGAGTSGCYFPVEQVLQEVSTLTTWRGKEKQQVTGYVFSPNLT